LLDATALQAWAEADGDTGDLRGRPCLMTLMRRRSISKVVFVAKLGKFDWIGLRENLQETIDFPIKYGAFLQIFP
jgi:hypothetical protein